VVEIWLSEVKCFPISPYNRKKFALLGYKYLAIPFFYSGISKGGAKK
jgi:hypothetical protein